MREKSLTPRERAFEAWEKASAGFQPKVVQYRAIVGDSAGNLEVSGYEDQNLYWVRIMGRTPMLAVAQCFDMIPSHDMHVNVEERVVDNRKLYVIVGRPDGEGWFDDEAGYGLGSRVGKHHWSHELGGPDMVNVSKYMMNFLRATPTDPASMTLYVSADNGVMFGRTILDYAGGTSGAFTAPLWGYRYDLLSIDVAGTLTVTQGTGAWLPADLTYPTCPAYDIPICYVLLAVGDTTITSGRIYDCRPFLTRSVLHAADHEDGGADEIDVTDLSGLLADPQNAGWLRGYEISTDAPGDDELLVWDAATSKWTPEPAGAVPGMHVHVYQEDLSSECNGAKTNFFTANQFEEYTLNVFHNGALLRVGLTKDYTEDWPYDNFTMAAAPAGGDTLVAQYLVQLLA